MLKVKKERQKKGKQRFARKKISERNVIAIERKKNRLTE